LLRFKSFFGKSSITNSITETDQNKSTIGSLSSFSFHSIVFCNKTASINCVVR
jgi:hypothetical protein